MAVVSSVESDLPMRIKHKSGYKTINIPQEFYEIINNFDGEFKPLKIPGRGIHKPTFNCMVLILTVLAEQANPEKEINFTIIEWIAKIPLHVFAPEVTGSLYALAQKGLIELHNIEYLRPTVRLMVDHINTLIEELPSMEVE